MELKHLIVSAKGIFGSAPSVGELSGFHTEGGTIQEGKYKALAFK